MSTASDHAEWLSLVETSGPFVSVPVLMRTFPQALDARNPEQAALLREAYEDWLDRGATQPAVHRLWVLHVLTELLGYPKNLLAEGQTLPPGLEAPQPQYGETIRPDFALKHRDEGHKPCLLIQTYGPDQDLDKPVTGKPWKTTPGTRMMELLHATDIPVGLITNGEQWMLVNARRGESTGFASWYADLWMQEPITLRAFHSLLGLRRLMGVAESETLPALLAESSKDQQEVTDQLGTQVRHAVEVLVQAFDRIDADSGRTLLHGVSEKDLYDSALTVMMRLVFLFSAEERGLLLLGDRLYDEHYAVSTLREQLREKADQHGEELLERRNDAWSRLLATFRVVHGGVAHEVMRLPAYGGSLFNPDKYPHLEGRAVGTSWKDTAAKPLAINNRVVLHLLEALQILRITVPGGGPTEARRISFRALDIEQIGHVYEGLLDHEVRRAEGAVLGLLGKKGVEPELRLADLEAKHKDGIDALIAFLVEKTQRTEKSLRKAIAEPEVLDEGALLAISGNDRDLMKRIAPFAALLRKDSYDQWMVVLPGSLYVTTGNERRSTGTHYTPRSLTEPVVQYTLEPLVYTGPAEGLPKAEWKLKTAKEILALKVCDMAMGSGAFLVQACRYLSERLVEAWEQLEKAAPGMVVVTPEGDLSAGDPTERIVPRDAAERIAVARRYVADRCLYGVDINPMAVEMAKLSLWLITLQKDRPFNFLDHAFKCGDSLLGVSTVKQIENFSLRPGDRQITLATVNMFRYVEEAATKRLALEALPSNDFSQIETKNRLHAEAERATAKVKGIADFLVALELRNLSERTYNSQRDVVARKVQGLIKEDADAGGKAQEHSAFLRLAARQELNELRTFHWAVEYPEVFNQGGFDALLGNPPFIGNKYWKERLFAGFQHWAELITGGTVGKIDVVALFFRRAFAILNEGGRAGLIATTTAREGASLQVGLVWIALNGDLYRAISQLEWPGEAGIHVFIAWFGRQRTRIHKFLDDTLVAEIPPSLVGHTSGILPKTLLGSLWGYVGSHNGKGECFILDPTDTWFVKLKQAKSPFLRAYLTGEDITDGTYRNPPRWCIDCEDFTLDQIREQCAVTYRFLLEVAQPLRTEAELAPYEGLFERWWQMWNHRAPQYRVIRRERLCIAMPMVAKHLDIALLPSEYVFTNKICVVKNVTSEQFATMLSSLFEAWMIEYGGTMGAGRLTISLSNGVRTFPMNRAPLSDSKIGAKLYQQREGMMVSRGTGFTDVYNSFHDPEAQDAQVEQMRSLQVDLDNIVLDGYGWSDIDLEHDYRMTKQGLRFTIGDAARREVLNRLLKLNQERYAEEVAAGLHNKKKGKGSKGKGDGDETGEDAPDLFTE